MAAELGGVASRGTSVMPTSARAANSRHVFPRCGETAVWK